MRQLKDDRLSRISVLLLEDEADIRDMLTTVVEERGASVAAYGTVPDALEALNYLTPDVIVSDIGLPEYNGYVFIGRVRAMNDFNKRNLPAIALTAFATSTDRDTVLTCGFQSYLSKPFRPDDLVQAILNLVGRKRDTP